MFDTHCHIQTEEFDEDRSAVLSDARAAGVRYLLVPAIDRASFGRTLDVIRNNADMYGALGIHPHSAMEWSIDVASEIEEGLRQEARLVAIGEIGLDYHYDFAPRDVQIAAFEAQIALAQKHTLPIIVHTRESDDDVFRVLSNAYAHAESTIPRGQLHCFSGTVPHLERMLALGFHVSFTGNITFKNSTLGPVVQSAPIDRILIETDSPYLAPVPKRGRRNTPANVRYIAERIAELKGLELSSVIHQTTTNALKLFSKIIALLLFTFVFGSIAFAQRSGPVGDTPPDSVLTKSRRNAEELRQQQQLELQREAEQRRKDSVAAFQRQQEELQQHVLDQARQDSIEAAQRIADEEAQRLWMLTPVPWKVIGIGGGIGITNTGMVLNKQSLTPTSVFASTFDLTTQILRRLDFQFGYTTYRIGDDLVHDSLYNLGPNTGVAYTFGSQLHSKIPTNTLPPRFLQHEDFDATLLSFDFRYVFTRPSAVVGFYIGAGFNLMSMTNTQTYYRQLDSLKLSDTLGTLKETFHRTGIGLLFGLRHDFEIGHGLTVTPYAQIDAIAAFQPSEGDASTNQDHAFVFQVDREQMIVTYVKVGVTLSYGWFGVQRLD